MLDKKDNTNSMGGRWGKMNEVFEALSGIFEELRNEIDNRKYSVKTEETEKADRELQSKNNAYENYLFRQTLADREFLEDYMETMEHAHYQEEQRAYYQGLVDSIQILEGLGVIDKRVKVKELLDKIKG